MKATAILHVRNEQEVLRRCFDHILENGLNIAVIDNESSDRTPEIIASYTNSEVIRSDTLEFDGTLNLPAILRRVGEVVSDLDADWIVYQGADEILQTMTAAETLFEGIQRIDAEGYTAINFHEIVFVPTSRWFGHERRDYVKTMRHYYFHQPAYPRLMRAWKNLPGISNFQNGGHTLPLERVKLSREDWILRHYIVRSFRQAREKYPNRRHSQEGLARGWHANRLNVDWGKVRLPPKRDLKHLAKGSNQFDLSDPWKQHFWLRYVK